MKEHVKGQGAQLNPHNRFEKNKMSVEDAYLNYMAVEEESIVPKTKVIEIHPKTIVNEVTSPDVGMKWSINPYQGCEHGCIYCYARNSHEYWGYSAGVDFERNILVKKNAAALLEATLKQKSWKGETITLSGNTDCYQPLEKKLEITRSLLQVFLKYKHPVAIITKNALIQRDLDILAPLQKQNLVHVILSVTTMDEELRRKMEPRTASIKRRLNTIETLRGANIPVSVMMAPIVPGLNDHEIFNVLEAVKKAGAHDVAFTMARLNGQIGDIFMDWVSKTYPDRAKKVINFIKSTHGGKLNSSQFGERMKGKGEFAEHIRRTFKLARKKHFGNPEKIRLDQELYVEAKTPQLKLF